MHLFIFGHPFALLVALILLPGVAFHFLNKKKTSVSRNVEDADTRAFGSLTVPTKAHSSGSSSSPIETYNNASSLWASSLTASTGNHYDVFLSFRGLDTRQGFTDHLYNGLVSAGVCTFRDDDELCQGKEIGPNLLAAIKNSKILIPVLSENYGSSKWCLDELVQMMECNNSNTGHLVLPIFYKVEPTHVRHQTERFGGAFRTREMLSNPKSLEKWKQALVEVSSLKGWEANRYEGDLVKSIVQKVLSELKKKFELIIPEKLVGIDSHVEKVMEFLNNDPHATLYVGIYGMGGIGKTTLAKVIYNKLFNQFESSFIADIRESCKRNGLEYLQNQLISDILKHKGQVHNKDQGTKLISSQFKSKRVFILLDDVDDDDQLKALVGNHNWFSSGSRIIITTRNKSILDNARVDYPYELEEMDKDKSLILFCRHAFRMDSPPNKFEKLTHDVVSTTRGLPLSLEILGSFLCGKEPMLWRGTINKLREVPHKKVREKLRISYEALEHGQKQIFLDIACFFIGTSRRIASYMWDACGFFPEEGIEVLRFMSLIKVGNNHELRMHDQLRDLGREIIREENQQRPEYRSRLWDPKEGLKLLKENKGKNIEAICLSSSNKTTEEGDNIFTGKQFKKLRNLRFLDMSGAHFSGDFKDSFQKLRWLRWQNCPLIFEAKSFHTKELVVLELSRSEISDRWQGWSFIMMAKKLKFLDLTHCRYLEGTFFLSAFKNLEVLILKGCRNLEQIDFSIGDMKSLVRLNLSGCVNLKELPVEMSKLEALEQLNLMDCRSISILPDNIGALQNLEILDIHRTRIKELPNSIGALQNLKILNISVTGIKELPGTIGTLQNLESLNISVTGIKELPSNIWTLQNLESLNISDTGVEKLPNGIGRLRKLQKLDASRCRELQSLPKLPCSLTYLSVTCQSCKMPSLSHLPYLKELHLINCKYLKCVLELPSTLLELSEYAQLTDVEESELQQSLNSPFELEILEIFCCESMDMLDVSQLNNLKTLSAQCCCNICEVRGLDKLKYLESVTITGYTSIERRLFPKSKGMKKLHVENCQKLVQIQGLDSLEFFDELCISNCASIERLDLPKSESMKKLGALYCEKLGEIQGLDKLRFLEKLSIIGCPSIKRLDLSKSMDLKVLNTQKCKNLLKIQGLNILGSLKMLYVSECASIKRLDLSKSEGLKVLHTENCENLIEIQGLHRLGVLEKLDISGCISIEKLNLPKSKGLKVLNAENCENLVKIQDLDRLEFLVKLYISGCTLIERLDLSKSKGLKKLIAQNCKSLIQIQGLNRLEFLEKLCVSGCASIKRLDLPKSKSMKILDTQNCKNLVKIEGLHRLDSLEELHISGCSLIEKLDFPKSKSLKILEDEDCKNLVEFKASLSRNFKH